ncbi:MAG: hypothetical protein KHX84_04200, partial [Enterocloster asparagiformis]|nr:hypothetical protein [Enterocloster asparagiformis]
IQSYHKAVLSFFVFISLHNFPSTNYPKVMLRYWKMQGERGRVRVTAYSNIPSPVIAAMHELYTRFPNPPLILLKDALIIGKNTFITYRNGGYDYGEERPGLGEYRLYLHAHGQALCG